MKTLLSALAALLALAVPGATPGQAGTYGAAPRSESEVIRAEVLGGWQTASGTRMAALRLTLAPGWKTYWRAPGEAGIPPQFDWTGSENLARVMLHWPRPEVFSTSGMQTIGYKRELVLPIELVPARPGAPIGLSAEVDLGVCEHICVPASLRFSARLAGRGAPDAAIARALDARPMTAGEAGVGPVTCSIDPIPDGFRVTARIPAPPLGGREVTVIEPGNPRIWASETETRREGDTLTATAELVPPRGAAVALSRKDLRFTVLGRHKAVDIRGCDAPG